MSEAVLRLENISKTLYEKNMKFEVPKILSNVYMPNNARILYALKKLTPDSSSIKVLEDNALAYISGVSPMSSFVKSLMDLEDSGYIFSKSIRETPERKKGYYGITPLGRTVMHMAEDSLDPKDTSSMARVRRSSLESALEDVERRINTLIVK